MPPIPLSLDRSRSLRWCSWQFGAGEGGFVRVRSDHDRRDYEA